MKLFVPCKIARKRNFRFQREHFVCILLNSLKVIFYRLYDGRVEYNFSNTKTRYIRMEINSVGIVSQDMMTVEK